MRCDSWARKSAMESPILCWKYLAPSQRSWGNKNANEQATLGISKRYLQKATFAKTNEETSAILGWNAERFQYRLFFSLSDSTSSSVGVAFLRGSLWERAHVTFGFDGHVIAVDFYLFSRRVCAVILHALAQRNHLCDFLNPWDMFLLNSLPFFSGWGFQLCRWSHAQSSRALESYIVSWGGGIARFHCAVSTPRCVGL